MTKFISDADMLKLEAETPKSKGFISDEDMLKLETESQPKEEPMLRQLGRAAIESLPIVGSLVGGVAAGAGTLGTGAVVGGGLGYAAGKELEGLAKQYLLGEEAQSVKPLDQVSRVAGNVAEGLTAEMGGQILGKGIEVAAPYVKKAVSKTGEVLGTAAEKFAVNATGATGSQAAKFEKGAGRELLDRGIVRAGDTAENIAKRAGKAKDIAVSMLDDVLKNLDEKGVIANVENVVKELETTVAELKATPGNESVIKQIQNQIDTLYERGASSLPVSVGEQAKRNFQSQVNYFSPEAEKKGATHVAEAFRKESERAALEASPELASKFTEAKKTYGLLKPIQEAAERRANVLNQSPFGGLGDVVAAGAGGAVAGPIGYAGGAATAVARRLIAPRVSSTAAVGLNNISKALANRPQAFGKFAKILSDANARGATALAAKHFILQQTNPEYQQVTANLDKEEE